MGGLWDKTPGCGAPPPGAAELRRAGFCRIGIGCAFGI